MESVILSKPLLFAIVLYGVALFLLLFDSRHRATRGKFTLISTSLTVIATGYSLILGASLWECVTVLLIFLLLNMEGKQ